MAVTGSIIVFYEELNTALNADLAYVQVQNTEPLPLDDLIAGVTTRWPESYVGFIDFPKRENHSIRMMLRPHADAASGAPRVLYVFIDPYTGALLGQRDPGAFHLDFRHIMDLVYQLHIDLLLGEPMVWLLGLVALLWLLDHFAAIILSFSKRANWIKSFKIRRTARGHRLNFDLHRAIGLWLFPVTFVLALSSVYLNWHGPFSSAVGIFSSVTPRYNERAPELAKPLYRPPVSFGAASRNVNRISDRGIDMVTYFPWQGLYLFRAYDDRDVDPYGRRLIAVDGQTGQVLDDFHAASGTAGDVFVLWQYPLHSGKAFGWTGRLIIFFSGIALTIICVTGVLIWSRKRTARRRRQVTKA